MIERQHGKVIIECDSCGELFEGDDGDDFASVWANAKEDGWRAKPVAKEWLHGCPKCGVPT